MEIFHRTLDKNDTLETAKKITNGISVKENLVNLISKIGEKITIRRARFIDKKDGFNYYYVHTSIEKNIGKITKVKIDSIKI